jgi:hypothetical protein
LTDPGLTTDRNGLFFLESPLPSGSTVSVSGTVALQGPSEPLSLQVQVSRSELPQKIVVNYPLHLLNALRKSQPSLSYAEAEAEIKRLLVIPEPWQLHTLEENEASPFQHGVFLRQASEAGGVETMTQQLLSTSQQGGTRQFTSSAGLTAGEGETSILGSIFSNLSDAGLSYAGSDVIGWVVRLLSQAVAGPADPFAGIDGQFLNLQNELDELVGEFKTEQVYLNLQDQVITPLSAAVTNVNNSTSSFVTPSPPLSLYSLGEGNSLLQALQTTDYEKALTALFNTLTGSDALVTSYPDSPALELRPERTYAKLTYPIVGIDSVLDQYGGYGAFSFHTTYPLEEIHDYYLGYATLAANLLAEVAHSYVDGVTGNSISLAQACRQAQLQILGTSGSVPGVAARKKQVQQLLPPSLALISGEIFIDREYGLMWCTEAVGGLTYNQAQSMASSLQIGPYKDGWRLPYLWELDQLYSRIDGGWINRTASQRTGKRSSVLRDLGFDLSQMSDTHHVWGVIYDFQNTLPIRYSLDTADTSRFYANGSHDVLFVRSYMETTPASTFTDPELSPVAGATLTVQSQVGAGGATQLQASMDFECPIGGQFTINGQTINPIYGSQSSGFVGGAIQGAANGSQQPAKDITTRVVWTSSNDQMALVSNLEGEEGKVYWRTPAPAGPQTCTFTASFQGTTGSIELQRPTDLQWQVDSVLLTPYLSSVSFAQDSTQEVIFIATVFMVNPVTGDRTSFRSSAVGGEAAAPPVTWSVESTDGTPIPSAFADPQVSNMVIRSTDTSDSSVIVKATCQGVTGQTTLYLLR